MTPLVHTHAPVLFPARKPTSCVRSHVKRTSLPTQHVKRRQVGEAITEVDIKLIDITALPFASLNLWPMRLAVRDGVPSYKICEGIYTELQT